MEQSNNTLGFIGMGMGSIALLLAIVQFWAGPFTSQPTLEQTVAEKAVAIKQAALAAMKGEEAPPPRARSRMDIDQIITLTSALLAGLAIILGVFAFAKKESLRVAGGAAILGGGALAFQFAVVALGAIVLAILIVAVLSQLGA